MDYTHLIFLISGLLFPATLITMEVGRRLSLRRFAQDPESARAGVGAVQGAVFAQFGWLPYFFSAGTINHLQPQAQTLTHQ